MRKAMVLALLLGGLSLAACRNSQPAPGGTQPAATPMAAPAAPAAPSKGSCGGGGKA